MLGTRNGHITHHINRINNKFINRYRLVGNAIDKRRIGTVFQQPPYQISKQSFMCSDRCIKACRTLHFIFAYNLVIKWFAHAVEALELELFDSVFIRPRQMIDRCHSLGIMRCKLRENGIGSRKKFSGIGNIGNICINFTCVNWKTLKSVNLRAFDFSIPIGTFDKAHHQTMVTAAGKINEIIKHKGAATTISLHNKADTVPPVKIRIETKAIHDIK